MTRPNRLVLSLAFAGAALTAIAVSARALSDALKPPPQPVVAIVDVKTVVDNLDEKYWREQDLKGKVVEMQAKIDKMLSDAKGMQVEVEALPAGPAKAAKQEEVRKLANTAKFETQYADNLLGSMTADNLRELYEKITAACRQLAQKNGYTMVLASDVSLPIPEGLNASAPDVSRAISMKRMLYIDPAHDVTQELLAMMNNAWVGAGNKPAPPPVPPAPPAPPPPSGTRPK